MSTQEVDIEMLSSLVREIDLTLSQEDLERLAQHQSVPLEERMFPPSVQERGCNGIRIKCWGSNPKCCLILTWPPGLCVKCDF